MKKSTPLFLGFLLILSSCYPHVSYDGGMVTIDSHVINPQQVIHLGDSVAFSFTIGDSITLDGKRVPVRIGTQDGGDIGFYVNKINSSSRIGYDINSKSCQVYANPGSLNGYGVINFAHRGNKLVGKLYFIPKTKGIYFFDQGPPEYIELNDKALKARTTLDFGNVNRNLQMLADSAGSSSGLGQYLQVERDKGWEVYGFRVI